MMDPQWIQVDRLQTDDSDDAQQTDRTCFNSRYISFLLDNIRFNPFIHWTPLGQLTM